MIILGSLESAKARSRLPIGVNSTFFARCYVWGATSEYRFKIGDFAPTGPGWPKSLSIGGLPINHFSQKTRLNHLSDGIEIWTDLSSVLSQCTRLTERRTDRISSPNRVCVPCSAVENQSRAVVPPTVRPLLHVAMLSCNRGPMYKRDHIVKCCRIILKTCGILIILVYSDDDDDE